MQLATNTYLKFVPYINFDLWDTKRYTSKSITSTFDIVSLGSCIKEENKKYQLFDEPEVSFGILGVNNKDGIFDAYIQKGKDINQAYKKMEVGWLAYNPYRINVGSIGIKKTEHKNEYISPAYVVFSCNEKLLPEFLFLLFKTETFNKVINESTTGSVRQNLTIDILKTLQIPLPSLSEQEALVKNYFSKIEEADRLDKQASDLESEIERYFLEQLGVEKTETQNKKRTLNFVSFETIEKWGVEYNLGTKSNYFLNSSKYKLNKLKTLIDINPTTLFPKDELEISFIPMECISDERGEVIELRNKKISESKGYTKFKEGDLIWARITPCMQNGKSAIVSNLTNCLGVGSTEFHVLRNSRSDVNIKFVHILLRLEIVLKNAMSHFTGSAGQQRVPKSFLENLEVPLPPLSKQQEIVNHIQELKEDIRLQKAQAEQLKQQAEQEFEQAIFSN